MSAVSQPDHLLGGRVSLPPSADIGRRDNEVRRGGGHGQREKGPPPPRSGSGPVARPQGKPTPRYPPRPPGGEGRRLSGFSDQRMRLECGVGLRQLRTCRRTRPGQLCADCVVKVFLHR